MKTSKITFNFLKKLRTISYVKNLKHITQSKNLEELAYSMAFVGKQAQEKTDTWKKYSNGTISPPETTLAIIENKYPGSISTFNFGVDGSPLWMVLCNEFCPYKLELIYSLSFNWDNDVLNEAHLKYAENINDFYDDEPDAKEQKEYNYFDRPHDIESLIKISPLFVKNIISNNSECFGLTNITRDHSMTLPKVTQWHLLTKDILIFRKIVHNQKYCLELKIDLLGWDNDEKESDKVVDRSKAHADTCMDFLKTYPFEWNHSKYPDDIQYDPSTTSKLSIKAAKQNILDRLELMENELTMYGLHKQDFIHVLKLLTSPTTHTGLDFSQRKKNTLWMNEKEYKKHQKSKRVEIDEDLQIALGWLEDSE